MQRAGERTFLSAMHLILYGRIILEILNTVGKVKGLKILPKIFLFAYFSFHFIMMSKKAKKIKRFNISTGIGFVFYIFKYSA